MNNPSCLTVAPAGPVVALSVPVNAKAAVMTRRGFVTFEAYSAHVAFQAGTTALSFKATSVAGFAGM